MCGIVGVVSNAPVNQLIYDALLLLQHRGQDAAGIVTQQERKFFMHKAKGMVKDVFRTRNMRSLLGNCGLGQVRYPTAGNAFSEEEAQPFYVNAPFGIVLVHNGNLTNTGDLAELVQKLETDLPKNARGATTDTEIMTALIGLQDEKNVEASALAVLPKLEGAFSLVFMDEHTLYAARDRHGVRPLVIGKLDRGWVVASESAALDIVGAAFVREVEPGEFLAINEDGIRSEMWAKAEPKGCIFEYVYLARPDTTIAGQSIHAVRGRIGQRLAIEAPVDADLVIPVPESGTPAAIGYEKQSGIPYGLGLVKNSYVGRTFIQPSQTIRQLGIRLKLNPLREIIEGKRIIVVDDSIVRGNTQRAIVRMLREAGAAEKLATGQVVEESVGGIHREKGREATGRGVAWRAGQRPCPTSTPLQDYVTTRRRARRRAPRRLDRAARVRANP